MRRCMYNESRPFAGFWEFMPVSEYHLWRADPTYKSALVSLDAVQSRNVSHELRTPLAIINANTELLMDDAHGGTISVESQLGRGACFNVSLPLGDGGGATLQGADLEGVARLPDPMLSTNVGSLLGAWG
jgi:hypothetical protein